MRKSERDVGEEIIKGVGWAHLINIITKEKKKEKEKEKGCKDIAFMSRMTIIVTKENKR